MNIKVYWIWDKESEILRNGPYISRDKAEEARQNEGPWKDDYKIITTRLMVDE